MLSTLLVHIYLYKYILNGWCCLQHSQNEKIRSTCTESTACKRLATMNNYTTKHIIHLLYSHWSFTGKHTVYTQSIIHGRFWYQKECALRFGVYQIETATATTRLQNPANLFMLTCVHINNRIHMTVACTHIHWHNLNYWIKRTEYYTQELSNRDRHTVFTVRIRMHGYTQYLLWISVQWHAFAHYCIGTYIGMNRYVFSANWISPSKSEWNLTKVPISAGGMSLSFGLS